MRKDEGYWAAVLLVGLANLTVTKQNWPSLWGWHAWPCPKEPHNHRAPSPAWRRWNSRMRRLARAGTLDELRRALDEHVARYNDVAARAPRQERDNWMLFEEAARVSLDAAGRVELADFSSFLVLRPPRARGYMELMRPLGTLRERLAAIADGREKRIIEAARAVIRARPVAALVIGRVERPPDAPPRRPYGRVQKDEWHDGHSSVRIFDGPVDHQERVEDYVDGLLLRAAQGGYWPRIARCGAHPCGRFMVRRVVGRQHAYCSPACRSRAYHTVEARRVRDTRRRRRVAMREELERRKREIASRIRAYQNAGLNADQARARVKSEFSLTDAALRGLMR